MEKSTALKPSPAFQDIVRPFGGRVSNIIGTFDPYWQNGSSAIFLSHFKEKSSQDKQKKFFTFCIDAVLRKYATAPVSHDVKLLVLEIPPFQLNKLQ